MFRVPVDFPRPVQVTDVGNQNQARVDQRLYRFIEYDTGVNIVVPQNSVWYPQWFYVRSVHAGAGLMTGLMQRLDAGNTRTLWRIHCPFIGAGKVQELFVGHGLDSYNDPTEQNDTFLAYRPMLPTPLIAGDEISFIETGHALGDYVECHLVVNEVIS